MSNMYLKEFLDFTINPEAQELEKVFGDLLNRYSLENKGAVLDYTGKLLNCERLGLSDENYVVKIKAFIIKYNSSGRFNEVLQALKLVTAATKVRYIYSNKGSVALETNGTLNAYLIDNLRLFIEDCLSAGVGLDYIIYSGNADSFTFDNIAGTVVDGKGFDNLTNTGDGGILTYLLT